MAPSLRSVLAFAAPLVTSVLADRDVYPIQLYSWYKKFSPQPIDYCFNGCQTATGFITFNDPKPGGVDDYYINSCSATLAWKSIYECAQKYCTYEEAVHGQVSWDVSCELYAGIKLPTIDELLIPESQLAQVPVLNATAAAATFTNPLNSTAIPDYDSYLLAWRTTKEFYYNWDISWTFTWAMIGFWCLVLLVGMIHRATVLLSKPAEGRQSGFWLWTRKNLLLPATFRKHQAEAVGYTYTIPPRAETILLVIFLIMNIVMCFPGYHLFEGNFYYPDLRVQLARYIGDRTGFLSFALLPMVWVFAARNNVFMWLTGWSFATFNRFHRWIARICVAHAVAHSIAWTMYEVYVGQNSMVGLTYYNEAWKETYWYMGGLATVVMCFMLPLSIWVLREKCYDFFLITHILLSVLTFVGLWYHVRIFSGEFNYFLYVCIAIWGIDRLFRWGRTIYISVFPRFSKGVKATACWSGSTDMIRLDVTEFFQDKPIVPGHYYYVYHGALRGYESHPFTLCSWTRPGSSSPSSPIAGSLNDKEFGSDVRPVSHEYTPGEIAHTLLVRPYKGMTGRLQTKLLGSAAESTSTRETVFIEGPYGHELNLSGYSDVAMLCGGSGIVAVISQALHLIASNPNTRIHIAFATPQRALPDDICNHELASIIHLDRINMTVYLTDKAEKEAHDPKLRPAGPYNTVLGRPDIEQVIRDYRAQSSRNLAIVASGPAAFMDACRRGVVKILGEASDIPVQYWAENENWY